jgi:hypothetical protein
MAKWLVELSGDNCDLEDLYFHFEEPEGLVIKEADQYFLVSRLFENLDSASEVERVAQQEIVLLSLAVRLYEPDFRNVQLGCVVHEDENGKRLRHVAIKAHINFRIKDRVIICSGSPPEPQISPPARLFKLIQKDDDVAKVTRLLGTEKIRWTDLYSAFEVIESDVGNRMYEEGWISRNQKKRFTRTVNDPNIIGDEARHGVSKIDEIDNPMDFNEACQSIRNLAQAWIRGKLIDYAMSTF